LLESIPAYAQLGPEPVAFARKGDGIGGLARGWGQSERWGTWATERRAVLRLLPPHVRGRRLRLGLRYRTLQRDDGRPVRVDCLVGERLLQRWEFGSANHCGEVELEVSPDEATDVLELTFVIHDAVSPAALGVGSDARSLAFGVEAIRSLG
jgi:hypothetical protein